MSNWKTACKWIIIISLLFFAVPIKINRPKDVKIIPDHNKTLLFNSYLSKFNKTYQSDEYNRRYEIFKETLDHINTLNHGRDNNHTALYGLSQFSDLSRDEFVAQYLSRVKRLTKQWVNVKGMFDVVINPFTHTEAPAVVDTVLINNILVDKTIPPKIDWRDKGIISEVANQGLCGACWAYSAIQIAEATAAKRTGNLTMLSVQEMIDCAKNGNFGCKGGDICGLLSWLFINNITIYTQHDYPVTGSSGTCLYQNNNFTQKGIKIGQYTCDSYLKRENEILKMVATTGPVAVAINALTWQYYLGGVIQHHCPGDLQSLNHAVQIVGYDLTAEIPYYIAKNSWGKSFGLDGYLHLAIGSNICGLASEVSSVQVTL